MSENALDTKNSNTKLAQIADRRLIEYFVIVSPIEQPEDPPPNGGGGGAGADGSSHRQQQEAAAAASKSNGDISFSDWKTESSGGGGNYGNGNDGGDNANDVDDDEVYEMYTFRPTITARYPFHDHPDNPLHENVTFFCHPSGRIQLRTEPAMPKVMIPICEGREKVDGDEEEMYFCCCCVCVCLCSPGIFCW
jgi:hypothetical protein